MCLKAHLQIFHVTDCNQTTAENTDQQESFFSVRYAAVGSHTLFLDEAIAAATSTHTPTLGLRIAADVMRLGTLPEPRIRSRNHDTSPPTHDEPPAEGAAPKMGPFSGTKMGAKSVKVNSIFLFSPT